MYYKIDLSATLPDQPETGKDQQNNNDPLERGRADARKRAARNPDAEGNERKHPPQRQQQRQI